MHNMKLEQQVVSLELAKQLKELGVEQGSLFYWIVDETTEDGFVNCDLRHKPDLKGYDSVVCSAFTVSELGEMLPNELSYTGENNDEEWELFFEKLDTLWRGYYLYKFGQTRLFEVDGETEAECRAKMLIFLEESGYLIKEPSSA